MIREMLETYRYVDTVKNYIGLSGNEVRAVNTDNIIRDISLRVFTSHVNSSGVFHNLVSQEMKDTQMQIDPSSLELRYLYGYGRHGIDYGGMGVTEKILYHLNSNKDNYSSQFFFDGKYGFVMQDSSNGVGVCASFDTINGKYTYENLRNNGINPDGLEDDLLIKEIQGPLREWVFFREKYDLPLRSPAIDNTRWEFVLIDTICLWAQKSGYQRIFLLPADNNSYFRGLEKTNSRKYKRGKMRYDTTAERIGFRKHESGLYVRDLQTLRSAPSQELYKSMFE